MRRHEVGRTQQQQRTNIQQQHVELGTTYLPCIHSSVHDSMRWPSAILLQCFSQLPCGGGGGGGRAPKSREQAVNKARIRTEGVNVRSFVHAACSSCRGGSFTRALCEGCVSRRRRASRRPVLGAQDHSLLERGAGAVSPESQACYSCARPSVGTPGARPGQRRREAPTPKPNLPEEAVKNFSAETDREARVSSGGRRQKP